MMTHMHKLIAKLLSFILFFGLTSCDKDEELDVVIPEVHRTILVYMVANNDLGEKGFDNNDIAEMRLAAQAGGLNGGRLIIYHAPCYNQTPVLKEITAESIVELKKYDQEVLSVSASRMKQVIADTKAIAPAKSYGIILWSHSSGWIQDGIAEAQAAPILSESVISPHSYGSDGTTRQSMNITTLANVLDGEEFDFIYCDCCHMANVETVYELRNASPYIIGSAAQIPAAGMRYDLNVPVLMQEGEPDIIQSARNTFKHYSEQPYSRDRTCTMSVISTAGLDELAAATRAIYASDATLSPSYIPQPFDTGSECKYFDLANYVTAFTADQALLDRWTDAMQNVVLYKANTPMIWGILEIRTHCGLSTYPLQTPGQATDDGYSELQWYQDVASAAFQ